jgi:hypothetical protein
MSVGPLVPHEADILPRGSALADENERRPEGWMSFDVHSVVDHGEHRFAQRFRAPDFGIGPGCVYGFGDEFDRHLRVDFPMRHQERAPA